MRHCLIGWLGYCCRSSRLFEVFLLVNVLTLPEVYLPFFRVGFLVCHGLNASAPSMESDSELDEETQNSSSSVIDSFFFRSRVGGGASCCRAFLNLAPIEFIMPIIVQNVILSYSLLYWSIYRLAVII